MAAISKRRLLRQLLESSIGRGRNVDALAFDLLKENGYISRQFSPGRESSLTDHGERLVAALEGYLDQGFGDIG